MATKVEHINPDTLPDPTVQGYTHVVRIGNWVIVAGQVATEMDRSIAVGDPLAQTKRVYERLGLAMESVGGTLDDMVHTKTYVTDLSRWEEMSVARRGMFGEHAPTSTLLHIKQLARPDFLIEVEAVGYVDNANTSEGETTMADVQHLQPATMSPNGNRYTHVIKAGPWVYIAGQTATDEKGEIVGIGDAATQTGQVYKNLALACESVGGKLTDIVKTTVYVVGEENLDAIREACTGKFGDKPPTSTLTVISRLARPEFLLEIEAVAYIEAG